MDRRRESRFKTDESATVRLLGDNPQTLAGTVQDISGKGMRLLIDRRLPLDSAVRVQIGKAIFLGEVCHCKADSEGFAIGLMLDQVLHESIGLLPLFDALALDAVPAAAPNSLRQESA